MADDGVRGRSRNWNRTTAILISIALVMGIPPVAVALEAIELDDSVTQRSIGRQVEFIEDKDKQLTLDDVRSPSAVWQASTEDNFNFGFTSSAYWFRFTVNNTTTRTISWYLEIDYPILDLIDVYVPQQDGRFVIKKTGDHRPFDSRDLDYRNYLFSLQEPPGTQTYYVRIESTSSMNFPFIMWSQKASLDKIFNELTVLWIFYGLMLIMILYNLFIYVSVRQRGYLDLVMFITSFVLMQLTINGFAFQHLWPNSNWWANNCLPFFICATTFWIAQSYRSYVESKKHFPKLNKTAIIFLFVLGAWGLFSLFGFYRISLIVSCLLAISVCMSVLIFSIFAAVRGSRPGLFMALSFSFFLLGASVYAAKTLGALPLTFVTNWGMQIGSSVLVVLLSLGLADRINSMRKNLQVLNEDLSQKKDELTHLNENLEEKVTQRTQELQTAMDKMEVMNSKLKDTKDALWGEMQIATKLQTILLPESPLINGYDISAYMKPATDVGGDYYDIINVKGLDWVVIGDVAGHGVPAGLIMMMVRTAIHSVLEMEPSITPSALLTRVNSILADNMQKLNDDTYMTMTVLACIEDGKFHFAGQHQDIMVYRKQHQGVDLVETKGMWLGVVDDIKDMVSDDQFELNIGDTMLAYTDGITEAKKVSDNGNQKAPNVEMFGDDRLLEVFQQSGQHPTQQIQQAILAELDGYQCHDDVTIVVIRRTA